MSNTVEIEMRVWGETDAAWKVSEDENPENALWLPKTVVNIVSTRRDKQGQWFSVVEMPAWLAADRELV